MNREKAIRLKYYDILSAVPITYDSGEVSIWDAKAEDATNNIYILLTRQSASQEDNFCGQRWNAQIDLVIVNKQPDTISKDTTDDVSEQIEDLLTAALAPGVEYEGWQILNWSLDSVDYATFALSETKSIIEKTLTFRQTIQKT